MTYSELLNNIDSLAAGFQANLGLKKGQCIALALPNNLEFTVTLLAANKCGAAVSLVNPVYTFRQYFYDAKDLLA